MKLLFKNTRLIDPATGIDEAGDLLVEGGSIAAMGTDISADNAKTFDCKGNVLCPGFIDMRAHSVDVDSALSGGITTIALQPNQTTVIDHDAVVERICRRSAERGQLNVVPMGAATMGMQGKQIAEIGQMQEFGAVAFTDCIQAVDDATVMRRLLEYAGHFDALVVQYAEEKSLGADAVASEGEIATRLGLASVPPAAEAMQIERDCHLLKLSGGRLHFALISSKDGVEAIRRAKADGLNVTCSTAPHYMHLNDNALEGYRTFAKVRPPLRSEDDRVAVIEAVADGTIDTIVSDHCPQSEDHKRLPFAQAAPGIVGFETLLPLLMAHVHAGRIDMNTALLALTATPAKLLGLDAGKLEVGTPANITVFDPEKPWRIKEDNLLSAAKNTPFDTLPVQGQVQITCVDGNIVFERNA